MSVCEKFLMPYEQAKIGVGKDATCLVRVGLEVSLQAVVLGTLADNDRGGECQGGEKQEHFKTLDGPARKHVSAEAKSGILDVAKGFLALHSLGIETHDLVGR